MNRIEPVIADLKSEKDLGERMELIMYALNDTVTPIPEEGNICTFKYFAKTPNIEYDQHPLVAVTDVFSWGFRGINFHWGQVRQYSFPEVVGGLYKVDEMELRDLRTIPFGRIRLNS